MLIIRRRIGSKKDPHCWWHEIKGERWLTPCRGRVSKSGLIAKVNNGLVVLPRLLEWNRWRPVLGAGIGTWLGIAFALPQSPPLRFANDTTSFFPQSIVSSAMTSILLGWFLRFKPSNFLPRVNSLNCIEEYLSNYASWINASTNHKVLQITATYHCHDINSYTPYRQTWTHPTKQ